jgi:hypothetical protein
MNDPDMGEGREGVRDCFAYSHDLCLRELVFGGERCCEVGTIKELHHNVSRRLEAAPQDLDHVGRTRGRSGGQEFDVGSKLSAFRL